VLVSFGDSSFACWSTSYREAPQPIAEANSILLVELEPIWKRSKFPWISWFSDSKQLRRTELSRHLPGAGNPSSVFVSPWVECRAAGRVMVGGMEEQGNEVLVTCSKSYFLNLFHYPRIEGHYNPFWILHSCAAVPLELSALGCVSIKVDQHCFLVRHCRLNLLHTLVFIFFILFSPLPNPPLANAELPTQQAKSPWAPRRVSQPR
jgi:hypothetical protein